MSQPSHQFHRQPAVSRKTATDPSLYPTPQPWRDQRTHDEEHVWRLTDHRSVYSPHNIPHEQTESVFGWNAEVFPVDGDLESRKHEFMERVLLLSFVHANTQKVCVPWCKRFCWWTWWISPDTRNSIWDNTWGSVCTGSVRLHTHIHYYYYNNNYYWTGSCVMVFIDSSFELLHLNLWSRYSRMILTICTSVRIKAPNASEPTWYLMRDLNNKSQITVVVFL